MRFLGSVFDLLLLNVVTLVCCIPVVTIGAALTGMNYCLVRIKRGEGVSVIRDFFHSFRGNFKQGTILWIMYLAVITVLEVNRRIAMSMKSQGAYVMLLVILFLFVLLTFVFAFPLLARFENTVFGTIKNAFKTAIIFLPQAGAMMAIWIVFGYIYWYFNILLVAFFVMFGLTLPGLLCTVLYDAAFDKLEVMQAEREKAELEQAKQATTDAEEGEQEPPLETAPTFISGVDKEEDSV